MTHVDTVCPICGVADEDVHHALIDCTLARALRYELRDAWLLPTEEVFMIEGQEWILHLLNSVKDDMRPKILFLLWRSWHHRNNVVHGDGKASITASVQFLVNYLASFSMATQTRTSDDRMLKVAWIAPERGALKANVDAGWDAHSRDAGIGIIIRDSAGHVVLTEWKFIPNCGSAEEAEILACLEGLKLLISLRCWPASVESDCLRAVEALSMDTNDRSRSWALILEGRELLRVYRELSV